MLTTVVLGATALTTAAALTTVALATVALATTALTAAGLPTTRGTALSGGAALRRCGRNNRRLLVRSDLADEGVNFR
jgi:hypothetical protein